MHVPPKIPGGMQESRIKCWIPGRIKFSSQVGKVGSRHSHLGSWMGLPGSRLYPAWHFTWDNTGLCLWWNAVYQLTCDSCNQQYIESTTCFIHNPVKEHLNNNKNSSIKKHIYSPQKKDYKGIDVKTIMSKKTTPLIYAFMKHFTLESIYQVFYIRKCKPTLNSQEECSEFADLLF